MKTEARKKAYRFGVAAEKIAAAYLRCKGYQIVAERYRNSLGEIDLVARRGNVLVAVEVKARQSMDACEETITPFKQRKIEGAMQGLLGGQGKIRGLADTARHDIRFDVVWVAPWRWPVHLKDAWRM